MSWPATRISGFVSIQAGDSRNYSFALEFLTIEQLHRLADGLGGYFMRMHGFLIPVLLLGIFGGLSRFAAAQDSGDARKVVRKVDPHYPETAKRMNIQGTVKVLAVVGPDGKVKDVQPVGGSPLLIQASDHRTHRVVVQGSAAGSLGR